MMESLGIGYGPSQGRIAEVHGPSARGGVSGAAPVPVGPLHLGR